MGGDAGAWARGVLVIFYGTHYPMLCAHTPPHTHTCPSVGVCQACTCMHGYIHVHKSVAGSRIYSRACSNSPSSLQKLDSIHPFHYWECLLHIRTWAGLEGDRFKPLLVGEG